ncbi:MAG: DUF2855 family protein, partial [Myxococcota bacterium]
PVWGFANVSESRCAGVEVGERFYGYFPIADEVVLEPARINLAGFSDGAAHRRELHPVYNHYLRCSVDPGYAPAHEAEQALLRPLFITSFLIDDFLADEDFFDAGTIVISSASSKTAIIAAYLLGKRDGIEVVGLTSAGNREFVEGLNVYDSVHLYDSVSQLPGERAVYVDVSGDPAVRTDVHARYGDRLAHSAAVGITHWTQMAQSTTELDGPSPVFFFAPDRIKKRGADWGTAKLDQNVADAWGPFAEWASKWLRVVRISSDDQIQRAYLELLDGKLDPAAGTVVSP